MRVKMEQYFQDNRTYVGAVRPGHDRTPAQPHTRISHTAAPGSDRHDLHRHGDRSPGHRAGRLPAYSLDQSNVRSTVMTAPSTWPSNPTCWVDQEGRIVLTAVRSRGFTIVELLVGVAILALLLGLGVPAMGTYLQNSKLAGPRPRGTSRGVQMARTEAIRRNVRTEFVLTNTPVSTADIANAAVPAVSRSELGRAGRVRVRTFVLSGGEGSRRRRGQRRRRPGADHRRCVRAGGVRRQDPVQRLRRHCRRRGLTRSRSRTRPRALCVADGGTVRCRRITVSPGGQIMACDPAAPRRRQPCVLTVRALRSAAFS